MAKVAIIGAGSLIFFKTLMNDFLSTPALAVDGTVKMSGRVPTVAQLKEMLA